MFKYLIRDVNNKMAIIFRVIKLGFITIMAFGCTIVMKNVNPNTRILYYLQDENVTSA
jgi:hypothetical protein